MISKTHLYALILLAAIFSKKRFSSVMLKYRIAAKVQFQVAFLWP